jgi:hypothetical protein
MIPVELPDFHAEWWPLRMETIPGSGEFITVAIMVRAASGQTSIRQAVLPTVLASIFGSSGKGVGGMVATCVHDLQRQLDAGVAFPALVPAFGGFEFGPAKDCAARDINDVFDIGVRLSCAFGQSNFGAATEAPSASQQAFSDWADRVRLALLQQQLATPLMDTPDTFNVRLKLGRKFVRFGLLRNGYAANFGVLRPGHLSSDTRSLKVKIFDLQGLLREELLPYRRAEVLMGCPTEAMLEPYSRREIEAFHQSVDYVETESAARGVEVVRFDTADRAAAHISETLQAA